MLPEKQFVLWLEERKLMERTIKEYKIYLRKLRFFGEFNQEDVDKFLRKNNNNVARSFIKTLRKFIIRNKVETNLSDEEMRKVEAIDIPEVKRKPKKIPQVISKEDVMLIHDAMENERNKIMLLLSYYCALRREEMVNVKKDDFNWEKWKTEQEKNGVLEIRGKGGRESYIFVPPFIMKRIMDWVNATYSPYEFDASKPIFKIGADRWYKILKIASQKALNKAVNPHLLRHSFATYLIEQGWNIREVQEFLRHADISSTQIYTHISKKRLDDKYSKLLGS